MKIIEAKQLTPPKHDIIQRPYLTFYIDHIARRSNYTRKHILSQINISNEFSVIAFK